MRPLPACSADSALRRLSMLICIALMFLTAAVSMSVAASPLPKVGPPYRYGPFNAGSCQDQSNPNKDYGSEESTIDAAVADYKATIRACYGLACTFTVGPPDAGSSPKIVAVVTLGSLCQGFDYIYATASSISPGDGGPGGDGDGHHPDDSTPTTGDPINAQTGAKLVQETDYAETPWLEFRRFYSSEDLAVSTHIGAQWRHSFDRSLRFFGTPVSGALMIRPDGTTAAFTRTSGTWSAAESTGATLTEIANDSGAVAGYDIYLTQSRHHERYNVDGTLATITDVYGQGVSLTYSNASTPSSIAPKAGLLIGVTDANGRALGFTYTAAGNIATLTLPDGRVIGYAYNNGPTPSLASVTYADGKVRQYLYNEPGLFQTAYVPLLTGIVDERGVRYTTVSYDNQGRATGMNFGGYNWSTTEGGSNGTQLTYNADGSTTVTSPLGHGSTMSFAPIVGLSRLGGVDGACNPDCVRPYQTRTYDANGYPVSTTDFTGNVTETHFNAFGQVLTRLEGKGTDSARTTTTTWDSSLRAPLVTTVQDASGVVVKKDAWAYDTAGRMVARCVIDASTAASYTCSASGIAPAGVRRWIFTYCGVQDANCARVGALKMVTGPRTDLVQQTVFTYYVDNVDTGCGVAAGPCHRAGDVRTITDAAGHVTTFVAYDKAGHVVRMADANGVLTDLAWDKRGNLSKRTADGAATSFTYTPFGELASVTDADGVALTLDYDAAHRMKSVTDSAGNTMQFTLDAAGNLTAETVRTSDGNVVRQRSQTFDSKGELTAIIDGLNQTIFAASNAGDYDAQGNLVRNRNAVGVVQHRSLDALRRLVGVTDDEGGTSVGTQNAAMTFALDAADRLLGVRDPSGLDTLHALDGLGNETEFQSPDSGVTHATYDAAGNRLTRTDGRGVVATSHYDALDRLVSVSYADSSLNVTYAYDESNAVTGCTSSAPLGRLTRIVESAVTTVYCYDGTGRVIRKTQRQGTQSDVTSYAYTSAGRLRTVTTPGQTSIAYTRDTLGNITSIVASPKVGVAKTIVSKVHHLPFGPVLDYTLGNGQLVSRTYDLNYAVTDVVSPSLSLHFVRDAAGRISTATDRSSGTAITENYTYDALSRITAFGIGATTTQSFTYNVTGDRLSKAGTGVSTGIYTYASGTHHLTGIGNAARSVDAAGNTTAASTGGQMFGFGYDGRNRLTVVQANGQTVATYTYNALGERISKVVNGAQATRFGFDEQARLLDEAGPSSSRDIVWMDDVPVAALDVTATTAVVNFLHADHIGTPRAVTNAAGNKVWSWPFTSNAFGEAAPVSSTGYVLNLRFPGQYFDAERGLMDNVNRSYEPSTGRYLQSDPKGLIAGPSTYLYANGRPLDVFDWLGLDPKDYRHVPYYPYGIWTSDDQAQTYPPGPGASHTSIPSDVTDVTGLGLGYALGSELGFGLGMGTAGSWALGLAFAHGAADADYANEPYIQHTMPRQ